MGARCRGDIFGRPERAVPGDQPQPNRGVVERCVFGVSRERERGGVSGRDRSGTARRPMGSPILNRTKKPGGLERCPEIPIPSVRYGHTVRTRPRVFCLEPQYGRGAGLSSSGSFQTSIGSRKPVSLRARKSGPKELECAIQVLPGMLWISLALLNECLSRIFERT